MYKREKMRKKKKKKIKENVGVTASPQWLTG
jgi:hypothetical protein